MTKPASDSGAGLWWVDASGDILSFPAESVNTPTTIAEPTTKSDKRRCDFYRSEGNLFTLYFPVHLPDDHSYFDNKELPTLSLENGLSVTCGHDDSMPFVLQISGFPDQKHAVDFCPTLRTALRLAALDTPHSIMPSDAPPTIASKELFDGNVPTVCATNSKARPYHLSSSMRTGLHISNLANLIDQHISQGHCTKAQSAPELSLAIELYSNCEFAGGPKAQFVTLLTALEVLLPKASAKGKRGAVIALVKQQYSKAGYADPKSIGKELDTLYKARNDLVHEAKAVTREQLTQLREIVRVTLRTLVI